VYHRNDNYSYSLDQTGLLAGTKTGAVSAAGCVKPDSGFLARMDVALSSEMPGAESNRDTPWACRLIGQTGSSQADLNPE
jgi:hypothetical protein